MQSVRIRSFISTIFILILFNNIYFTTIYNGFYSINIENKQITNQNDLVRKPIQSNDNSDESNCLIDQIFSFNMGVDSYLFNISLEKFHKYRGFFKIYVPDATVKIVCEIFGPDSNGDNNSDYYEVAEGYLNSENSEFEQGSFFFGSVETGNYTLNLTIDSTENTNIYFLFENLGSFFNEINKNGIIYNEVFSFSNNQKRQIFFNLDINKVYSISIARINSITWEGNPYSTVNLRLYSPINQLFDILNNRTLFNVFEPITSFFGSAMTGQYRIQIGADTNIPAVNTWIFIKEEFFATNCNNTICTNCTDNNSSNNESFDLYNNSLGLNSTNYLVYSVDYVIPFIVILSAIIISYGLYYNLNKEKLKKLKNKERD